MIPASLPPPVVIEIGGSVLARQRALMRDVCDLMTDGTTMVLVHGAGPAITRWVRTLGLPVCFKNGMRVTDRAILDVVRMVLCGKINPGLVSLTSQMGARAVGVCGADAGRITAHVADPELGLVGTLDAIQIDLLQLLLQSGFLPIVAPLGQDAMHSCLSLNADQVAASLACALGAQTLIFVSDVTGITGQDGTCLPTLTETEAHHLIRAGLIMGGMFPKVQTALTASAVVSRVLIVDGREPQMLARAILPGADVGTTVRG